jgi:hypothetical protein
MRRSLLTVLWLAVTVLPCQAAALPPHYIDLLRQERFEEAEAAAAAEIARVEAIPTHKKSALCAALDQSARVNSFDLYQSLPAKLARVEQAINCRENLPNDAANAAQLTALKAASATLVFSTGDRPRASALFAETQAQLRLVRGRLDALDYATAANSLSNVATQAQNDFEAALTWTNESLAAVAGDDVQSRMMRAKVLAVQCYRFGRLGRFGEAEAAGTAAVELSARMFGMPSAYHAHALQQLGEVQYFAHHLADAALTIERAIDDSRKLGDRAADNLPVNLMIYADIQTDIGDYGRGRAALTEAIALQRRDASAAHQGNLGSMLSNLGMLEAASGHCDAALAPEREALEIVRRRYGESSYNLSAPLTVLGNCELETGELDKARADTGQSFAIAVKSLGEDNPQVAEAYQEIALVDLAQHDYATATARLEHALGRLPQDPDTLGKQRIAIERNLARSLHAQHHDEQAFEHAVAGETTRQRLLQHFANALDESEGLGLHETELDNLDEILALAVAHDQPSWIERAWQLQIGSRGQITRLVAARLKAARASAEPAMRALWQQWKGANAAYADALAQAEAGKAEANLAQTRDALERSEQTLAAQTHALDSVATVDIAALHAALPGRAALVGFVRARSDPWDNDYASAQHAQHYFAFRLVENRPIALIDLGDAREIDAAIRDWSAALRDPGRALADVDALGSDVARRVWQPLGLPDDLRRVLIVPEGELHRLAWLALPLRGTTMAERDIAPQLLDTEREIIGAADPVGAPARPLLVGAVPVTPALAAAGCGAAAHDLPGARRELDALRQLWHESTGNDALSLTGDKASKAAVRSALPQSDAVHFATHAFSDDGSDCANGLLAARGIRLSDAATPRIAPGLSGLVLAADAHAAPGDRDGLLTALEIATFDLDAVHSVTLAACDTGGGPVRPDEGVFGLVRAFRLAGARNVVMSLWSVDDEATADFMQRLYRARWSDRESPSIALASAARATLAARRAAGKSTHPYYWAAFVSSGN